MEKGVNEKGVARPHSYSDKQYLIHLGGNLYTSLRVKKPEEYIQPFGAKKEARRSAEEMEMTMNHKKRRLRKNFKNQTKNRMIAAYHEILREQPRLSIRGVAQIVYDKLSADE